MHKFSAFTARELADHIARQSRELSLAASYLKALPGHRRAGGSLESSFAQLAIRADEVSKREASR